MNKPNPIMMVLVLVLLSGCVTQDDNQNGYVNGTIEIKGYALGSNMSSYMVEVGESFNSTIWSTAGVELTGNGTSEVANGTLARWDTTAVSDGKYTIRLTVTDTNNISNRDLVYVSVDNIFMTSPQNNSIINMNDSVEIIGSAVGYGFINYSIDYAPVEGTENWSSAGISLTNNGNEQVNNGTLALWETGYIEAVGRYTLRLRVSSEGMVNEESTFLRIMDLRGDFDGDGNVSDFELLDYVDNWVNGFVNDFDLLEAIDNWVQP
ncbi:MAG: hypothetical protein KKE96_00925 [Candidatus Altiarchaeota archaeon]|nr:hypothetical protein [Candidatus Altiarchaeota archaeon]MBU4405998.1 hypothetical protein [Candidatus Altiarchaeota archaeon]